MTLRKDVAISLTDFFLNTNKQYIYIVAILNLPLLPWIHVPPQHHGGLHCNCLNLLQPLTLPREPTILQSSCCKSYNQMLHLSLLHVSQQINTICLCWALQHGSNKLNKSSEIQHLQTLQNIRNTWEVLIEAVGGDLTCGHVALRAEGQSTRPPWGSFNTARLKHRCRL